MAILGLKILDLWRIGMKQLIKATLGFALALGLWQAPAAANLLAPVSYTHLRAHET